MQLTILGKAVRNSDMMNRWLVTKGCPPIAAIYEAEGSKYDIRWDVALFQSIHETNWFRFTGDVKAAQNNFAGIGATGNGVPGDSFSTVSDGVLAQMQNLALRCGTAIPKEEIISPYVRKNYDTIRNRNSKYWSDLTGTWASDPKYWDSIQAIIRQFDAWAAEQTNVPESDANRVTWIQLNRADDGRPAATAYADDESLFTRFFDYKKDLIDFFAHFPRANSVLVAETDKVIIPNRPDIGQPSPTPTGELKGKKFLADAGHSLSSPGAHGQGPASSRPEEYHLNRIQAKVIEKMLTAEGAQVDLFDPDPDNLSAVGRRATGKTAALFLHHNAANGGEHGSEVFVHPSASASCRAFASKVLIAICKALGTKNRGVKEASYTVLVRANEVRCEHAILVESYFVDAYSDRALAEQRSTKAAKAISEAAIEYFSR